MAERIVIKNATIVNEGRIFAGNLFILNGIIERIVSPPRPVRGLAEGVKIIDGKGKFVLPGVIDEHVHLREPGLTHKGDIWSETRAAVAGGVTSVMDMPNTVPKATTLELVEEKFSLAAEKSFTNYSFYLGATNYNFSEIQNADPSKICGLKLFLGASTGNMLVDDQASLDRIFMTSPLLIAVHAEDESVIRENLRIYGEKFGDNIPVEAHPLIRSAEACFISSLRAVKMAKLYNARLHLLHLSTARELDLLDNSLPLEQKRITGEACVNHLWFDDRDYKMKGSRIRWNPAVKAESDKNSLLDAVLDDRIDTIATDHSPHAREEKTDNYRTCPSGAPLVQHSLVAMLEFYRRGKISLERIVEKMCHGPAILYRIKNRGFIREGYAADLVLVDPDSPWEVNPSNILYKCGWSPMEGQVFSSRVTHTIINGNVVYENGFINETYRGLRLEFQPQIRNETISAIPTMIK